MHTNSITVWLLLIFGGFFAGSIMFSKIIPQAVLNTDICESAPDRNPGAANVFSACGVRMGTVCLICDMLKGFLPVYIGCRLLNTDFPLFAAVIAAPALGHAIAPLNRFQGGKCIATIFGELLGLLPLTPIVLLLAALYIFFSVVIKIDPTRIRSIAVFGLFGISALIVLGLQHSYSVALGCAAVSLTAIVKHLTGQA